jgi:hypothetical protein
MLANNRSPSTLGPFADILSPGSASLFWRGNLVVALNLQ